MLRSCASCQQPRPLRDFDLGGGQFSATCLDCASERARTDAKLSRSERAAKLVALETQRRSLIAALVKVDAEIATLRDRPSRPQISTTDDGDDEDLVDTPFGEDNDDDGRDLALDELS
ncbi:MAG TPA: hypothetical protein VLE97_05895 [Gaiellaceae bacterium]|nr:hypothetical protein [Gaiellaceae bacterium]